MVFRKQKQSMDDLDPIEVTNVTDERGEKIEETHKKPFDGEIFIMPREFYVRAVRGKRSSSKILLTVLVVLLIVFAFGSASLYVLVFQNSETSISTQNQQTTVQDSDAMQEDTDNSSKNSTSTDSNEQNSTATTSDEIVESAVSEASFPFIPFVPSSIDIDRDGLTDVEESLIGSDERVQDTDGDSFLDGAELLSGFDPTVPREPLSKSTLFQQYVNTDPVFSLSLPKAWQLTDDSTDSKKIFLAINGDTITIELFTNKPPFTITQWLVETYPATDIGVFSQTSFNGFSGFEAQNGRQVLINLESHVALITYDVGAKKEVAYPAVWEYILLTFGP